jgi:CDP-diacylglycerol--glycerol-3-phosphate 3-phosphatidyltransferase
MVTIKKYKMNLPNLISLVRFILAFITLGIMINFEINTTIVYICLVLTIISFLGDYLDGFLARKLKQSSELGAWLDIAADRSVEMGYLIVFVYLHWLSPWIALVFLVRGIFVDGIRSLAQQQGYTAFGDKTMMENPIGQFLVSSHFVRGAYGIVKVLTFLTIILAQEYTYLKITGLVLAYISTVFCLARGIPVILEGLRFFKDNSSSSKQI